MRNAWLSVVLLLVATPVLAQDQAPPPVPRFDVYVGPVAARTLGDSTQNLGPWVQGGGLMLSFGWNFTRALALVVDDVRFSVESSAYYGRHVNYSILAGPRVRFNTSSRLNPFGQMLVGASQGAVQATPAGPVGWQTLAQIGVGGGLDLRMNNRLSLRLAQLDIRHVFGNPGAYSGMSFSAGVVIRFGARVDGGK